MSNHKNGQAMMVYTVAFPLTFTGEMENICKSWKDITVIKRTVADAGESQTEALINATKKPYKRPRRLSDGERLAIYRSKASATALGQKYNVHFTTAAKIKRGKDPRTQTLLKRLEAEAKDSRSS